MWCVSSGHRASWGAVIRALLLVLLVGLDPTSGFRRLRVQFPIPINHNLLEPSAGQERTAIESVNPKEIIETTTFPTTETETHLDVVPGSLEPPVIVITGDPPQNKLDYRLPRALKPLHYAIKVQPFINGNYSVHGSVEVDVEVLEATSNVTLHTLDLGIKLNTVKLIPVDDRARRPAPSITHFTADKVRQFFVAHLNGTLQPGQRLRYSMEYIASLHDQTGFIGDKYSDSLGNERNILSNLFQPTYARQAFPCFDEPGLKATFLLDVVREESMTAISNMPLHNTTPIEGQEGWVVDHFGISPHMPTYLLILIVSQLEYGDVTYYGDLPIKVWARPEVLHLTTLAQQIIPEFLAFYEQYFNISYPLPKLDFIALPSNYGIAFEGWGTILSYDETFLLYNPATDQEAHKQTVLKVQAHEIAHQWFGNLVTPQWWDNIWLSEGFASYLHHLAMNHVRHLTETVQEDTVEIIQEILYEDSWGSHPLNLPVFSPQEIEDLFDVISYYKGTCIIHMMSHFLSEHTFRKGINSFLKTWKYKNVGQDDLWQHLTKAAHEDDMLPSDVTVKMIMDTWTLQTGYPVIKVVRSPDGTSATVYQEKFKLPVDDNSTDNHFYKWWVPITYTSQDRPNFSNTRVKVWMKDSETQIRIHSLPSKDHWVIFNLQEINFYRVNYDDHNWKLLIHQLKTDHTAIHVINRAQLVDDALDLALAGKLSYKTALNVTQYLVNEDLEIAWKACFYNIEQIQIMLQYTPAFKGIQKYLLSLLAPLYKIIGLNDVAPTQAIQREHSEMVKWACDLGHPDCIHLAKSLYWQWMKNPKDIKYSIFDAFLDTRGWMCANEAFYLSVPDATSLMREKQLVPANMRGTVYCTAIAYGGAAEWQFAWSQYFQTTDDEHKDQLVMALGCSKDPVVKAGYLDMAFTPGVNLRKQDPLQVFSSVASQVQGQDIAWNFLLKNWKNVTDMFGKDDDVVNHFLKTATKYFNSRRDLTQLEMFVKTNKNEPGVVRASESVIHQTNFNIAWMEKNYDTVCEWLKDNGFFTSLHNS